MRGDIRFGDGGQVADQTISVSLATCRFKDAIFGRDSRLCCFGQCPKGKPQCRVTGCGAILFLQQHEDFAFTWSAAALGSILLYRIPVQPDSNAPG